MGIYRAAFTSIEQTEPLMKAKTTVPVVTMGGATGGLGAKVSEMVRLVAEHVEVVVLPNYGHFLQRNVQTKSRAESSPPPPSSVPESGYPRRKIT
jgi:hypothetical protein